MVTKKKSIATKTSFEKKAALSSCSDVNAKKKIACKKTTDSKAKASNFCETSVIAEAKAKKEKTERKEAFVAPISSSVTISRVPSNSGNSNFLLDHSSIAKRAWEIWQREGCPEGRDLEHWLQAEKELRRSLS